MILDKIIEDKKISLIKRKENISLQEIKERVSRLLIDKKRGFKETLEEEAFVIIGEFKKASPSKGVIEPNFDIDKIREAYEEIGVQAFSVLTEENYFLGNDSYLRRLSREGNTPTLRKDFVIDEYQIYEARVLGAKAILLIVAILGEDLKKFYDLAIEIGLDPLVEVHNKEELEIALRCNCEIIGINNRNLKTFHTDLKVTEELIELIPKDKIVISESGMFDLDDIKRVKKAGAKGVLIGEGLMRNLNNAYFKNEIKEFLKHAN